MMNKVLIFSAPSGAGKTSVVRYLLSQRGDVAFSVSATTRQPRGIEVHGKDYFFISQKEFEDHIAKDDFVEWEQVYSGSYYGTLKSEVQRLWDAGKVVLFDVDVAGGLNLKNIYGDSAMAVFVMPPSIEELENRLRKRGTESEEKVQERVKKAKQELEFAASFDRILLNDNWVDTESSVIALCNEFIAK
jgi:guanylate kinase